MGNKKGTLINAPFLFLVKSQIINYLPCFTLALFDEITVDVVNNSTTVTLSLSEIVPINGEYNLSRARLTFTNIVFAYIIKNFTFRRLPFSDVVTINVKLNLRVGTLSCPNIPFFLWTGRQDKHCSDKIQ